MNVPKKKKNKMSLDSQLSRVYTTTMAHMTRASAAIYPLMTSHERLLIWEKARGIWKGKRPDPIHELEKMRKEWDRKLIH